MTHVPSSLRTGSSNELDDHDRYLENLAERIAAARDKVDVSRMDLAHDELRLSELLAEYDTVSQWQPEPVLRVVASHGRLDARTFPSAGADERETWRDVS